MNKKNKVFNVAKEHMVDTLKLPRDFVLGESITYITGCQEVFVENYKGIIECCKEVVSVQTKTCRMNILGCDLNVVYYTDEEMKITGNIKQINFYE